jgi:hypothetical protein
MTDFTPEEEAFLIFRRKYALQTPPPVKPSPISLRTVGFQFWLYLVVSIASVLLAAMRTTEAFYNVAFASSANPMFSYGEASLAVFAIEGGLVVYAAAQAIRKNKTDISGGIALVGIVLMIGISMIAGLVQSTSIITNIDPRFQSILQYSLAITLGLGVSIIAYISGEILGGQVALVTLNFGELLKKYDDEVSAYNHAVLASWRSSRDRRLVNVPISHKKVFSAPFHDGAKKKLVINLLDAKKVVSEELPQLKEIMDYAHVSKSFASEVRSKWAQNNNGHKGHKPEEIDNLSGAGNLD